jgi:hypothetical protein
MLKGAPITSPEYSQYLAKKFPLLRKITLADASFCFVPAVTVLYSRRFLSRTPRVGRSQSTVLTNSFNLEQ